MKRKFVFICAAGHSGSTLLDLLLGSHPDGVSLGEITQLPKNIALDSECSCGKRVSKCEFWHAIVTEFGRSIGTDLWQRPYTLNLGFIRAGQEIDEEHQTEIRMALRKITYGLEYARLRWRLPLPSRLRRTVKRGAESKLDLFHLILDHTDRQFVVDSSKHYLEALSLYQAAPNETRIVHLVRDGRAVFNSGLGRGMQPKDALAAWARHCRRSSRLLENHVPPSALLTLRYESLAANPELELKRICEFLGIGFHPAMLDFASSDSHIANGNRMRFRHSSVIELDERWRNELAASSLRYFESRAGKLNRALGYRPEFNNAL